MKSSAAKIRIALDPDFKSTLIESSRTPAAIQKMIATKAANPATSETLMARRDRASTLWADPAWRAKWMQSRVPSRYALIRSQPDEIIADPTGQSIKHIQSVRSRAGILGANRSFTRVELLLIFYSEWSSTTLGRLLERPHTSIAQKRRNTARELETIRTFERHLNIGVQASNPASRALEYFQHVADAQKQLISSTEMRSATSRWAKWWTVSLWIRLMVDHYEGVIDHLSEQVACSLGRLPPLVNSRSGKEVWLALLEWIHSNENAYIGALGWENLLVYSATREPAVLSAVEEWSQVRMKTTNQVSPPTLRRWMASCKQRIIRHVPSKAEWLGSTTLFEDLRT